MTSGLDQSEVQLDAASNTGTQTAAVGATPFPAQPPPTYMYESSVFLSSKHYRKSNIYIPNL